jgi:hypothetical protein
MIELFSCDLEAARALLAEMRSVAQEHGEPALWAEWAKAATNLMNDLGPRDLEAARALLAEMRSVAQERDEPGEEWAKAATNLMIELFSRDLKAARALLAEMRSVAQERGEPALWEWWAKAATNLMIDLGSRDPEAARAFLAELSPDDLKRLALVIEQVSGQASSPKGIFKSCWRPNRSSEQFDLTSEVVCASRCGHRGPIAAPIPIAPKNRAILQDHTS